MNGAEALLRTLIDSGVEVCFANPGTSEMHFVAALDRVAGMRCVLGLFEGVVTGAADGYSRIAGKPAATLLVTTRPIICSTTHRSLPMWWRWQSRCRTGFTPPHPASTCQRMRHRPLPPP